MWAAPDDNKERRQLPLSFMNDLELLDKYPELQKLHGDVVEDVAVACKDEGYKFGILIILTIASILISVIRLIIMLNEDSVLFSKVRKKLFMNKLKRVIDAKMDGEEHRVYGKLIYDAILNNLHKSSQERLEKLSGELKNE